ncbi:MAG: O-methyltransferase [Sphingobacterium sp.]
MINRQHIQDVLTDLHRRAEANRQERERILEGLIDDDKRRKKQAELRSTAYLSISAEQGDFVYLAARSIRAKHIVEFGCSFGISTIYLAWAAEHSGGTVTTTELESQKWDRATRNLQRADLDHRVTLLKGDALETLKNVVGPVDLLFLDGEKSLYLPVFNLLRSKLRAGSMVIADNIDREDARSFVQLMKDNPDQYVSVTLFEGRILQVLVL